MSVNGVDNRFLTDDIIVKEALRLLKNNLVFAPLVYRDLEKRFAKKGDTISLKQPFRTRTASGRTLVKQPLIDQTIPFAIDKQEHFGLEITVRDRTLSLEQFSDRYLKSGIVQLANVIDSSIAQEMALSFHFASGTPGTQVTAKDFNLADAYMTDVGVFDDDMRRAVLTNIDAAAIANDIMDKNNDGLVKSTIQKGYMGPLGGFSTYRSANMYTHTVGAYAGSGVTNGANQTGSTLVTDGWSTGITGLLKQGDIITINGVYEINPQSYRSTGRLKQFVVTADVDSDGSGNASIPISPAINDGTGTTTDEDGNTISTAAYRNVSAAVGDGATITPLGTASTQYRQNMLFHRDAVGLVMVDLELPQSAPMKARVRDEDSGLALSMTGNYDINNHSEIARIDAVWGVHTIYSDLGHRQFSDNIA